MRPWSLALLVMLSASCTEQALPSAPADAATVASLPPGKPMPPEACVPTPPDTRFTCTGP